jgi:(1->4)-alpha-D-glucan 1-alpha-D-glucosylmutase
MIAALPEAADIDANTCWYVTQSLLDIYHSDDNDFGQGLKVHMIMALSEAIRVTLWSHPNSAAENAVTDLAGVAAATMLRDQPEALTRLIRQGQRLSLIQTALKLVMPGVPDIYRGAEREHLALTDPDNRLPVDLAILRGLPTQEGFAGRKARLTQCLLQLRRDNADFFDRADVGLKAGDDGVVTLTRVCDNQKLSLQFHPTRDVPSAGSLWPIDANRDGHAVTVAFSDG